MFYIDPSLSSKLFKLIDSYSSIPSFFFLEMDDNSWGPDSEPSGSLETVWRLYFFKHILLYPQNESWECLEECLFPGLFWDEIDGFQLWNFEFLIPLDFPQISKYHLAQPVLRVLHTLLACWRQVLGRGDHGWDRNSWPPGNFPERVFDHRKQIGMTVK